MTPERKIVFEQPAPCGGAMLPRVCLHLPEEELSLRGIHRSVSELWSLKVWARVDSEIQILKDRDRSVGYSNRPARFPDFYMGPSSDTPNRVRFYWAGRYSREAYSWCSSINLFQPNWLPVVNLISNAVNHEPKGVDLSIMGVNRLSHKLSLFLGDAPRLLRAHNYLAGGLEMSPELIRTGGLELMTKANAASMRALLDL